MIPNTIRRDHVEQALKLIAGDGVPKERRSRKFDLVHGGRRYPPKYVLSIAGRVAIGADLQSGNFSGGDEANGYLAELGFEIRSKGEDWSPDECYLAVWGYDQLDQDRDLVKVEVYRQIADLIGRSEDAAAYKIQNVSACDPRPRSEKPVSIAENAQGLLREVFEWYWRDRPQARELFSDVAAKFQFSLASDVLAESYAPLKVMIEEGGEGGSARRKKRSRRLLDEGRRHFRAASPDGQLHCSVCAIATPKGVENELIQLHHSEPLYEFGEGRQRRALEEAISKLIPLCPTCHVLAHSGRPPLSVEAIKELLRAPPAPMNA